MTVGIGIKPLGVATDDIAHGLLDGPTIEPLMSQLAWTDSNYSRLAIAPNTHSRASIADPRLPKQTG